MFELFLSNFPMKAHFSAQIFASFPVSFPIYIKMCNRRHEPLYRSSGHESALTYFAGQSAGVCSPSRLPATGSMKSFDNTRLTIRAMNPKSVVASIVRHFRTAFSFECRIGLTIQICVSSVLICGSKTFPDRFAWFRRKICSHFPGNAGKSRYHLVLTTF